MGLVLEYFDGQTALDEEEREGLLIGSLATRGELDMFEHHNIQEAVLWSIGRKLKPGMIFSEVFIKNLHKRMYGKVWGWAGDFRKTNKNIGVDKWQISISLKCLLDDALLWLENNIYPPDEFTIRFKHRLVAIPCFPNGNGRHSRLMADIIIEKIFKKPVFSWGANVAQSTDARCSYLSAIRIAGRGDIMPLVNFARS